ncbi:hypothetical protein DIPPA_30042 [Diplonema papillatum]|nr:hypothetical protein DIPPA_30042 [Diplonema papillatum]
MVEATAKWKFVSGFMNAGGFTKRESAVVREGFDRVSAGVDVAKTAHAASSGSVWQRDSFLLASWPQGNSHDT